MVNQKNKTKEELFVLKLLKLAGAETPIDRYKVGNALGYHTKSVDNIVQNLTKNNFLKKVDDTRIYLTKLGASLGDQID